MLCRFEGRETSKASRGRWGGVENFFRIGEKLVIQAVRVGTSAISLLTGGAERVHIDSLGNVGIGNNSPDNFRLRVLGFSHFSDDTSYDASRYGMVQLVRRPDATDKRFHLSFIRAANVTAGIGFVEGGNTICFLNGAGDTSTSTGIFVRQDGNVGIGARNPLFLLQTNGNTWNHLCLQKDNQDVGQGINMRFLHMANQGGVAYESYIQSMVQTEGRTDLNFWVSKTTGAYMAATLNSNGYLGIGTNPQAHLHVNGHMNMTNSAYRMGQERFLSAFPINTADGNQVEWTPTLNGLWERRLNFSRAGGLLYISGMIALQVTGSTTILRIKNRAFFTDCDGALLLLGNVEGYATSVNMDTANNWLTIQISGLPTYSTLYLNFKLLVGLGWAQDY